MTTAAPEAPEALRYDYQPHPKQAEAHAVLVDELLYGGAAGGGKALALDTPILTAQGWATHGQLQVGDQVFHPDGRAVPVTAVSPIHRVPTYRVTFSNGEQITCSEGHLWAVLDTAAMDRFVRAQPEWKAKRRAARASKAKANPHKGPRQSASVTALNQARAAEARKDEKPTSIWEHAEIVETRHLATTGQRKPVVPYHDGVQGTGEWKSALPPWAYGMWLGDGGRKDCYITQGDEDAPLLIERMEELGCALRSSHQMSYRLSAPDGRSFRAVLMDEHDMPSQTAQPPIPKRIPDWAYIAPREDREALLAGLVDSDGHVNARGQVEFCVTDGDLARDFQALIATLGHRAGLSSGIAFYTKDGERVVTGTRYTIKFTPPSPVASYPRKQVQANPTERTRRIYITSVEQVDTVATSCITVGDESGLYLAGRTLMPTHNSRMARAEAVSLALMVPEVRIVLFRRTFPDLQRSVEEEMKKEIPPQLGSYNHSKHMWTLTNDSIIELAHLQREDDIYKYQGAEYALIVFEELTHFTEKQYLYLKSRLRVAGPVRKRMKELKLRPRMMATANPGGIGHHWVRKRFVDPAPANTIFRTKPTANEPRPGTRCYVPARVTDNPSVNPEYIDMLNALPETQRKALRDGDWDVLEGVRFADWSAHHHVIRPEQLPMSSFMETGQKVIAVDYGTRAPFAALWMVKLSDDLIVVYREAYQAELTPIQQAELIRDLSADEEAQMGREIPVVCDPSMWNRATAGSPRSLDPNSPPPGSPAHAYQQVLGRMPLKAVNERVNGWTLLDEHLRVRDDGLPRLLVYETCRDLIRTLPAAPRDKKNPDDIDTTSEDHVLDAARYGAMHLAGKRVLSPAEREEDRSLYAATTLSAGLRSVSF